MKVAEIAGLLLKREISPVIFEDINLDKEFRNA